MAERGGFFTPKPGPATIGQRWYDMGVEDWLRKQDYLWPDRNRLTDWGSSFGPAEPYLTLDPVPSWDTLIPEGQGQAWQSGSDFWAEQGFPETSQRYQKQENEREFGKPVQYDEMFGPGMKPRNANQDLLNLLLGPEGLSGGQPGGFSMSWTPLDYTSGFPESPAQRGAPDYSEADKSLGLSMPSERETSPNLGLMQFLSGVAAGAGRGESFGQSLAAAGALGLEGLTRARTYEEEIRNENARAMEEWNYRKAAIQSSRAENSAEMLYQNDQALYEHQRNLHALQLKNQEQKLPQVQSTASGLMVTSFNPESGQMETKIVPKETLQGTLTGALRNKMLKALTEPESLYSYTFDPSSINVEDLPLELWPHGMAAMLVLNGLRGIEDIGLVNSETGEPIQDLGTLRQTIRSEKIVTGLTGKDLEQAVDLEVFQTLLEFLNNDATAKAQQGLPPQNYATTILLGQ